MPQSTSGRQVRPWVRYWARSIDLLLFGFLSTILLALIFRPALEMPDTLFGMVLLFAYVFVEAAMLAFWGTTPGKSLLKVRLRDKDGRRLSFEEALNRAFKVWFFGQGMGIPFVFLLTQISAFDRLKKYGITIWDAQGRFTIDHETIGVSRILATSLSCLVFLFISVVALILILTEPSSTLG